MDTIKRVKQMFEKDLSLARLLKILVILLIVYLISLTSGVWGAILNKTKIVLLPFVIGFGIAYIVHPLVAFLETKKISKKITIPITVMLLLLLFVWIIITLLPLIYNDAINFITSMSDAVGKIYAWYVESNDNPSQLVEAATNTFISFLNDYKSWFPNLPVLLPQVINSIIEFFTNSILAVIVAIYVLFDYRKITNSILSLSKSVHQNMPIYIGGVNEEVSVYIRSLLILMVIKFVEYSLLYYLMGHRYWMIMGVLMSLGLLIPYFGATLANIIGVLTALTMSPMNVILLIILIAILAMVDGYIISPLVHARKSEIKPLWTLFSVFLGGTILGALGVMLAIPAYMSIRQIFRIYRNKAEERNK
jgi:Predicted permease